MLILPCRPKPDSASPRTIWAQFKPKLPHQKPIPARLGFVSALGSKSALGNRTVLALIKCHIITKNRTVFFSPKRPQLAPFLRLKQVFLVYSVCKLFVRTLHTEFSMSNILTTWNRLVSRFMEDVNTRQQFSFSFSDLRYSPLELTPEKFPNIWQIKWNEIRLMKFEKARVHFLTDVFAAVAVA